VAVISDTLTVATAGFLRTAESLYRWGARLHEYPIANPESLGPGGTPRGRATSITSVVRVWRGIGLVPANAIVWHVGRIAGRRVSLSTGHTVAVSPATTLLTADNGLVGAEEVKEGMLVPIYFLTAYRGERMEPPEVRAARAAAVLLLSKYAVRDGRLVITPLVEAIEMLAGEAFHRVHRSNGNIIVGDSEWVEKAKAGIVELVTALPLRVLASAGYLAATMLADGVNVDLLRDRIPLLSVIFQFAGWVMEFDGDVLRTVRVRRHVYNAEVAVVGNVEGEFYELSVPGHGGFIGNGLVLATPPIYAPVGAPA